MLVMQSGIFFYYLGVPLPLQVPQEKQLTELCMTVVFSGSIFPVVEVLFEKLYRKQTLSQLHVCVHSAADKTRCGVQLQAAVPVY